MKLSVSINHVCDIISGQLIVLLKPTVKHIVKRQTFVTAVNVYNARGVEAC